MRWRGCGSAGSLRARRSGGMIALCLLALMTQGAAAQADPFRPSAPPATQAARPAQPGAVPRANAQAEFMWVVDPRSECRAQIRRRGGVSIQMNWDGNCHNGVAEGAGTLILLFADSAQTRCELTLRAGRAQGRGVCMFPDGHRAEAEYADGRTVGPGTLIFPDGTRYHGMLRDGLPHGRGTLAGPTLLALTGEWQHGCLYEETSGQFVAVLRDAHTCAGGPGGNPN